MSKVKVTLAHGAFIDGKYIAPGTERTVTEDEATTLAASGYVVSKDPEVTGAPTAPGT